MTRYREICTDIAGRVSDGRLQPGEELPGVRELAQRWGTTISTVGRAERCLADAGVVTLAARRRARVAVEGVIAARRLLHAERVFRLAGSDDPALDLITRNLGTNLITVSAGGSFDGLRAVRRGLADGAAIHLLHHTGTYNVPFARALLRDRQPHLIHLWRREQGLIVAAGNPAAVTTVEQLAPLRVVKRHHGTGTRVLLDRLLITAGQDPDRIRGPEVGSHLEVALAVATGIVDAGLGVRSAALDLGLGFVPLTWEDYDIVLGHTALDAAAPLIAALHDRDLCASITRLGGYDTTDAGAVRDVGDGD
ncbi:helix-turn-helix transcriptional regulator [Pseudonocardia acidicola]|uniref:GntR family transcriptional regulator n=1 Tax=Pseudonocardia acidicola TaxID=2724939 RepID=A0ABX1SE16_9PSEU|nr:helix-turn-helix transcriptional regulator [Pseudonocardia acidicola]NMH98596.1 GntR family transcriptional regulator [Pseudonocardia acidicola]